MRQFRCLFTLWTVVFLGLFVNAKRIPAQHGGPTDAELSVKKLQVAPGLSVALFASEPLLKNPVAFSIDELGRFFIAETHRYKDSIFDITRQTNWLMNDLSFRTVDDRAAFLQKEFATNLNFLTKDSELIRLVEDRDNDGRAETSSIFADGFNETTSGTAAGILARKGEIWFTSIPDLWKFSELEKGGARRLNGQKIASGFGVHIGVSGHDLHGLALGPDGKIYFSVGDRGFSVRTKEGKFLNHPDTGGVLRCNQDGSDLEVFATGLRNPQELAFDQFGNLFTADNDTAGEDNSRFIHVVEGGDYGWRASYQFMDGYGPWVKEKVWQGGIDGTLAHSGDAAQGPSGLAFYPGPGLPEKYQNHFLACDFPKGVWSFAVQPKGASYEITNKEKFLWNLGATDVDFGPDGSAYVTDWGQSYSMPDNGRIYRIFDPESRRRRGDETHSKSSTRINQSLVTSSPTEVKNLLVEGMQKRSVEELANLLGHRDLRVRMEAQFEFGRRSFNSVQDGVDASLFLQKRIQETTNQFARIHIIRAMQSISVDGTSDIAVRLLKDADPEVRAQAARWIGETDWRALFSQLISSLRDENSRVRFFAAMSLGNLKSKESIPSLLEMLKRNGDVDAYLVHAGVWALANIGDFEAIQLAAKNENVSIRRAALLAMRRMERPEIAQFLNDAEPRLVAEAARAINDVPINEAMPQLAAMLQRAAELNSVENAAHTNSWEQILLRAINANFRLGKKPNAVALASFAASTAPLATRIEALDALSDWENPNPLDRVMGLWRPLPKRAKRIAVNAIQPIAKQLLADANEKILIATIIALRKLGVNEVSPALFELFQNPKSSSSVRVEVLRTFMSSADSHLSKAVELAFISPDAAVRREAIKAIALLSPDQTPLLLEKLFVTETDLRLSQTAFATLGTLTNSGASDVVARQLDRLLAGQIAPELQLDLLDAAANHSDRRVTEKLGRYKASLAKNDSLSGFRIALVGGNSERGKKIFNEREDVACLRCHAIKGKGGTVGPELGGIASKQSREYLLDSIVHPNKTIAVGYENILVTLKSGGVHAGVVKSEDATELVLNSPEDGIVKIKKADIEKRDHGLSSMPDGVGDILTKAELRDLVEFLAGLK